MLRAVLHSRHYAKGSIACISPSISCLSLRASSFSVSPFHESARRSILVGARAFSGAGGGAAGSGAGPGANRASEEGASSSDSGGGGGGAGSAESEVPFDEPFVARASRVIWGTIKLAFGTAFFGGVLYAGYSILTVLIPVGSSSNSIMRKASDILAADPDVLAYFGPIKTYGVDLGGRAEGRRFFVPEYKYEDTFTGDPCVLCRP
jgi:hypothetical protein